MHSHIKRFLEYYFNAITIYNIHSPRIYTFISSAFDSNKTFYCFLAIETEREALKNSKELITVIDLGAGSKYENKNRRKLSKIVSTSASNQEKCRMLFNIVRHYKPRNILELGTNLGLASAYLASGNSSCKLYTVEGDPSLFELAKSLIDRIQLKNVNLYNMSFSRFLEKNREIDFDMIYIDGDHKLDETLAYFQSVFNGGSKKQIIIIDDINWSIEMQKAWKKIKSLLKASISIDIYKIGIILVDPEIKTTQHLCYIPWKFKPWKIGLFAPRAAN